MAVVVERTKRLVLLYLQSESSGHSLDGEGTEFIEFVFFHRILNLLLSVIQNGAKRSEESRKHSAADSWMLPRFFLPSVV